MEDKIKELKTSMWYIFIILVIIALMDARKNFNLFNSISEKKTKQYEYKIEYFNDLSVETDLNSLGSGGWQVIGSRRATSSMGSSAGYECILMKEK